MVKIIGQKINKIQLKYIELMNGDKYEFFKSELIDKAIELRKEYVNLEISNGKVIDISKWVYIP